MQVPPCLGVLLATVLLLLAGAARAALPAPPELQAIDPQRSSGEFRLRVLLVGSARGRFAQIGGQLRQRGSRVEVCADLPTASARMDNPRYEQELKGPAFFHAARHPRIRFRSAPVDVAILRDGGTLPGRLTLRGRTRPVRFEVRPLPCAAGSSDCGFRAAAAVQRSEFGMNARRGVLGGTVRVELQIRACAAGSDCGAGTQGCF